MASVWYWLDGAGQWMTRWHCTNGDSFLASFTIASCLWMLIEYLIYAYKSHKAMRVVAAGPFRDHVTALRNVFVECGLIHALNMILCWFWTPYWLIVGMTVHNAWQAQRLNRSKSEIYSIQQHAQGVDAIEQVESVKELIVRAKSDSLHVKLEKLERALGINESNDNTGDSA